MPDFSPRYSSDEPICPCCCNTDTHCIGAIPDGRKFAGRVLDEPLKGGYLYRCGTCSLHFRYPQHPKELLDQLYKNGTDDNWSRPSGQRVDWWLAYKQISRYQPKRSAKVLDLGCYDGRFLKFLETKLPSELELFGIESHPGTAKRAHDRGVKIIGDDVSWLGTKIHMRFDVISAIDLIEHVQNPYVLLSAMANSLHDDGLLFIATGNSDAPSWRMMGSKYWYCTNAEHISFINREWLNWASERLGLTICDVLPFRHGKASMSRRIKEFRRNLRYKIQAERSGSDFNIPPPKWASAKDHIACVMRRLPPRTK